MPRMHRYRMMNKRVKQSEKKRNIFQIIWSIITNGYMIGFLRGTIYQGKLKSACVPGLNCYSCMGALGSCPIGSLQAELGLRPGKFPFYMFGFFMITGTLFGRLVCGFMCPFGLLQDLLHKVPKIPKIRKIKGERYLVKIKYLILVIFVIGLPLWLGLKQGLGDPAFCKFICPQGTLEGGIPHVISNPLLRKVTGVLFNWKLAILITIVILSMIIYRPFCKYICPLGAIYSFFNSISVYKYSIDRDKCIECGACEKACMMNVNPLKNMDSTECIRCGRCKAACPVNAIESSFSLISAKGYQKRPDEKGKEI